MTLLSVTLGALSFVSLPFTPRRSNKTKEHLLARSHPRKVETVANLQEHRFVVFHDTVFESDEMVDPNGL